jgi:ADP-ribosylglycohydrolase
VTTDNFRDYFQAWFGQTPELDNILNQVLVSVKNNATTLQFCQQQGMSKAVSGYCYHTLPVVLHIYLTHQNDFEQAISQSVQCGGDTDTIAAIVGGIIGARVGKSGIPKRWLQGLKDWPCLPGALSDLAQQLARVKLTGQPERAAYFFFPMVLIRNLLFMVLVLAHGFRRLLPPY